MIDISEFEDRTSISHAALRILQENGVSVPKPIKMVASRSLKETAKDKSKIFGVALADIEERDDVLLDDRISCDVPHFLAECLNYLEEYVTVEGLFRKAGSVARQKDIKVVCACVRVCVCVCVCVSVCLSVCLSVCILCSYLHSNLRTRHPSPTVHLQSSVVYTVLSNSYNWSW